MLFNSVPFLIFVSAAFALHWLVPKRARVQNAVLLGASLVFYGWWDVRALSLFVGSVLFTGLMARWIRRSSRHAKSLLTFSILILVGVLATFKYYNFFAASLAAVLSIDVPRLSLILPLGISFYTFMCISFLVDTYTGKLTTNPQSLSATLAYLMFFPQIAAGPIGRANEMLPQFNAARTFDNALAVDGCRQFLWGMFKKMVIADGCAGLVTRLFLCYRDFSGSMLALGAFMYAIQIYADFSGYSDMAIGVGKVFGIRLRKNFNYPYFATNIGDFWRRWHMSLTTWFRDYVYIPLGGSRCWLGRIVFNTWVVFLLSGLWHGAAWTFVAWGAVHAVFLTVLLFWKRAEIKLPSALSWLITMISVVLAWIFFRAPTFDVAWGYLRGIFSPSLFTVPTQYLSMMPWIVLLLGIEWFQRHHEHGLSRMFPMRWMNWGTYLVLIVFCLSHQVRIGEFIYFQF